MSAEHGQSPSSGSRGPGHRSPSPSELREEDKVEFVEHREQHVSSSSLPSLVLSSSVAKLSESFCSNADIADKATDGLESCSTFSLTPVLEYSAKQNLS